MNEQGRSRGPNWGLVLLVPAAVILTKAVMRHRAMWESGWSASAGGGRYGHHAHFGTGDGSADEPGAFRLPPRIESMLDTWHRRAHQADEPTEPAAAT